MSTNDRGRLDKKKRRARQVQRARYERRGVEPEPLVFETECPDPYTLLGRLPDALQQERLMRRIALASDQRVFSSGADLLAGLEKVGFKFDVHPMDIADALAREFPLEEAQDLAFLALDPSQAGAVDVYVEIALEIDPDCVDAAALSALFDDRGEASTISALEVVVTRAEIALGGREFLAGCGGHLWDHVLTRPYLRARRMLADVLLVAGRRTDAEAHFTDLFQLDSDDHLDAADTVLGYALERGELERARQLAALSESPSSLVAPWARALERWLAGDRTGAARFVRRGRTECPLVVQALLRPHSSSRGRPVLPIDANDPGSRRRADAVFVELRIGAAWRAHMAALAWLAGGAHATTPEQREAACSSFAKPVSALLGIGDEGRADVWIDYATRFGLSSRDVGELLRMATDAAMNDLEEEDPRSRAAAHAWRALGALGAVQAIGPMLAFSVEQIGDQVLVSELQAVLARIGGAAMQPLIDVVQDAARPPLLRGLACESLVHLAGGDAGRRARARTVFASELEWCERNSTDLNAWLVIGLVELRGADLAPVIRRAYEHGRVQLSIAGDWASVAAELDIDA